MTSSIQLLGQVTLDAAETTVYQVPSQPVNAHARINAVWIANTDSAAHTVTLRVGTGTLSVANSLGKDWPIAANSTIVLSGSEWLLTLLAGMKITGLADSGGKIVVTLSGDLTE